ECLSLSAASGTDVARDLGCKRVGLSVRTADLPIEPSTRRGTVTAAATSPCWVFPAATVPCWCASSPDRLGRRRGGTPIRPCAPVPRHGVCQSFAVAFGWLLLMCC